MVIEEPIAHFYSWETEHTTHTAPCGESTGGDAHFTSYHLNVTCPSCLSAMAAQFSEAINK